MALYKDGVHIVIKPVYEWCTEIAAGIKFLAVYPMKSINASTCDFRREVCSSVRIIRPAVHHMFRLFGQLPVEGSLAQRPDNKKYFLHLVSVVYGLTDLVCICQFRHGKGNIIKPGFITLLPKLLLSIMKHYLLAS